MHTCPGSPSQWEGTTLMGREEGVGATLFIHPTTAVPRAPRPKATCWPSSLPLLPLANPPSCTELAWTQGDGNLGVALGLGEAGGRPKQILLLIMLPSFLKWHDGREPSGPPPLGSCPKAGGVAILRGGGGGVTHNNIRSHPGRGYAAHA